jgi:hypothetical protein
MSGDDIIRGLYKAFDRRDWAAISKVVSPDAQPRGTLDQVGERLPCGGRGACHRGRAQQRCWDHGRLWAPDRVRGGRVAGTTFYRTPEEALQAAGLRQ